MARAGGQALIAASMTLATASAASPLAAQSATQTGAVTQGVTVPVDSIRTSSVPPQTLTPDLERIRHALETGGRLVLTLPEGTALFRVDVEAKFPTLESWLGDVKLLGGLQSGARAYHAEFLNMVTPQEATASFSNSELLQVLATALAGKLALQKVVQGVKGSLASARNQQACAEVQASLADLNLQRALAGLPPVPIPDC